MSNRHTKPSQNKHIKKILSRPYSFSLFLEEKRGRLTALEDLTNQLRGEAAEAQLRSAENIRVLDEMRLSLTEDLLRYAEVCRETEKLICTHLTDYRHRVVLEAHYLGFAPWPMVAEQTFYSERHVKRLHREALQILSEHMYCTGEADAG